MDNIVEIWKDIVGYEGLYQISNYGRVKSLAKEWQCCNGIMRKQSEQIKKLHPAHKYMKVTLYNNKKVKTYKISILVWEHFGDGDRKGMVIDHIDGNTLNDNINNLQLLSARDNVIKGWKTKRDLPTGVYKNHKRFEAFIMINGNSIYLGTYDTAQEASNKYQEAKKKVA